MVEQSTRDVFYLGFTKGSGKWSASLDSGSRQSQIELAFQFWSLVLVLADEGTLSAGDRAVAVRGLAWRRAELARFETLGAPTDAALALQGRRHAPRMACGCRAALGAVR